MSGKLPNQNQSEISKEFEVLEHILLSATENGEADRLNVNLDNPSAERQLSNTANLRAPDRRYPGPSDYRPQLELTDSESSPSNSAYSAPAPGPSREHLPEAEQRPRSQPKVCGLSEATRDMLDGAIHTTKTEIQLEGFFSTVVHRQPSVEDLNDTVGLDPQPSEPPMDPVHRNVEDVPCQQLQSQEESYFQPPPAQPQLQFPELQYGREHQLQIQSQQLYQYQQPQQLYQPQSQPQPQPQPRPQPRPQPQLHPERQQYRYQRQLQSAPPLQRLEQHWNYPQQIPGYYMPEQWARPGEDDADFLYLLGPVQKRRRTDLPEDQ